MVDVYRITSVWQGFQGAPGYTKFSFMGLTDATKLNAAGASVRAFFNTFAPALQTTWTITVQPTVQIFEMANGILQREEQMSTAPAVVTGTTPATTTYAGGTGLYITWITGSVYNGHRVRGRTYMVPLLYVPQSDGTLSSSTLTTAKAAADTLISSQAGQFAIWSRTWSDTSPPTQIGGGLSTVIAENIPDKMGILRSRRD